MQYAIEEIITEVPKGAVFDSHFVIARLIKFHSDEYLNFASGISSETGKTLAVHGKIGQEIAKFESDRLRRLTQHSFSENIHGNVNCCTCWEKL